MNTALYEYNKAGDFPVKKFFDGAAKAAPFCAFTAFCHKKQPGLLPRLCTLTP